MHASSCTFLAPLAPSRFCNSLRDLLQSPDDLPRTSRPVSSSPPVLGQSPGTLGDTGEVAGPSPGPPPASPPDFRAVPLTSDNILLAAFLVAIWSRESGTTSFRILRNEKTGELSTEILGGFRDLLSSRINWPLYQLAWRLKGRVFRD